MRAFQICQRIRRPTSTRTCSGKVERGDLFISRAISEHHVAEAAAEVEAARAAEEEAGAADAEAAGAVVEGGGSGARAGEVGEQRRERLWRVAGAAPEPGKQRSGGGGGCGGSDDGGGGSGDRGGGSGGSSGGAAPEPEKAREVGEEHFCDGSRKNHGCDE